jgi:hypothetical protein
MCSTDDLYIKKKSSVVSEAIRLKQKKHLLDIINNDNSEYDSTYGFEWCGKNSLVIITGDLIDNYRSVTVDRTDIIINEEIKIVLFLIIKTTL